MARANQPHPRGFTLLELVVALAMVAILAGGLYASLRIAFRAQASSEQAIAPARTAALAFELIGTDIRNALPPGNVLVGAFVGTDGTDERGRDGDDLFFYNTGDAPEHPSGNGEIKSVELSVEVPDGSNDHVLLRRVTRNLLSQIAVDPDEEVICRGVAGFNLRYYDGMQWQDSWDSSQQDNALPLAVEVTLDLDRAAPLDPSEPPTHRYVRVFPIACSSLAPADDSTEEAAP